MVADFSSGGAAVSVLARQAGARAVVVDAGVGSPKEHRRRTCALTSGNRTAHCTGPSRCSSAACRRRADRCSGRDGHRELDRRGCARRRVDGRRSCRRVRARHGLAADGVARKVDVVRRALAVNRSIRATASARRRRSVGASSRTSPGSWSAHTRSEWSCCSMGSSRRRRRSPRRDRSGAASSLIAAHHHRSRRRARAGGARPPAAARARPEARRGSGAALASPLLAAALAIPTHCNVRGRWCDRCRPLGPRSGCHVPHAHPSGDLSRPSTGRRACRAALPDRRCGSRGARRRRCAAPRADARRSRVRTRSRRDSGGDGGIDLDGLRTLSMRPVG